MSSHVIDDLRSSILDFQANEVRIAFRKKTEPVDPFTHPAHTNALREIWEGSKLDDPFPGDDEDFLRDVANAGMDAAGELVPMRWRKVGFETEDLTQEFAEVGVLGLECLVRIDA
jgi:engulfment/cell motility protein 1